MPLVPLLEMLTIPFNLLGLVVCLVGLTMARRRERRWPWYGMAGAGFLIAATPTLLAQLLLLE
ncbi:MULTISPECIES: hypothetical protein [Halomonadaceae]|uniref:Uncharacterized protein n=1 Tax=Billgrantia gudaonensis TaxID=376427 RepID=A0A1G8MS24_9GAMM|nr:MULTISPECIES: hypothetical protein [Halomonas]SDI70839.1 hypothetical protein SAMN04487954_101100 [Halomonas gudaonensis]